MLLYMRRDLTKDDFALESTFPIKTPEDVIMAAESFDSCAIQERNKLARVINSRAEELGMKIPSDRASTLFKLFGTTKNIEVVPNSKVELEKDGFEKMIKSYERLVKRELYIAGYQASNKLLMFYILIDTAIALSENPNSQELLEQYQYIRELFYNMETNFTMKHFVISATDSKALQIEEPEKYLMLH